MALVGEPILKTEDKSKYVKRQTPGSLAFVPSVAGLIVAGEVIKDLIAWKSKG